MRVLTIPELETAAKIVFDTDPRFDDAYFEFCAANPDLRIERNSQGEIIIVPPADTNQVIAVTKLPLNWKFGQRGRERAK